MRLFILLSTLLVFSAGGTAAQEWPRLPLVEVGAGDTLAVELPGRLNQPGHHLSIAFLRTVRAAPSSAFRNAPDSIAFSASRDGRRTWDHIGGLTLPPFVTACHVGDFDLNGRIDLFLEWITGGNGAASSGGAIYKPDTRRGGYDLATRDVAGALQRLSLPASQRLVDLMGQYEGGPTLELARDLAAALGELVAWSISTLNESSLERRIKREEVLLERLIAELGLPVGSVEELRRDALERLARIRDEIAYPPPGLDEETIESIHAAVIRHMVHMHDGWPQEAGAIAMAVSNEQTDLEGQARVEYRNPTERLLARLSDVGRPVLPVSSCESRLGARGSGWYVRGSETRVIRYRAERIRNQHDGWVRVDASYWWGGLAAAGWTFTLRPDGDDWRIVGVKEHWIS